jgi:hypothetical protein
MHVPEERIRFDVAMAVMAAYLADGPTSPHNKALYNFMASSWCTPVLLAEHFG